MSARSVCSGTRPSEYISVRAISAPPRRPETWILQPFAPERIALVSARFIARRKATRRVDLRAGLADDDARAGRVDVDLDLVGVLADRDVRQPRVGELARDVLA